MSECDATEVMTFDGAGRNSGWWVIIPLNDKFAQADSEPRLKKKNAGWIDERTSCELQQGLFLR